jgi:uncharacterized protein YjbI with pentapeptide repeats
VWGWVNRDRKRLLDVWRRLQAHWEWRWVLRWMCVVGALAGVAAALILPSLLIGSDAIHDSADRAKARSDLRTATIQSLGVLALLLAGWYTARTYRLGREGQLTERFKAGVEMLDRGGTNTAGGMLALERVARDSPRDHPIVMELVAMYARSVPNSEDELRIALRVIGRRELRYDVRCQLVMDLTNLMAQDMKLTGLNLEGADLSGSRFDGSLLSGLVARRSLLKRVQLIGTDLQSACLDDANLTRANLSLAVLTGAKLRRAQLREANLTAAMLMDSDLSQAELPGADLTEAQLHGASFAGANLQGASLRRCMSSARPPDFRSSILTGAHAEEAVLPGADFREADLTGANFDRAVLSDADLRGANLDGASFRGANLTGCRRDGPGEGTLTEGEAVGMGAPR